MPKKSKAINDPLLKRDGAPRKRHKNGAPMGLKRGSHITVDPIRSKRQRYLIWEYLKDRPRDLLLFAMGTNNGLRTADLLRVKVGMVRDLKPGEGVKIKESKTGKWNLLSINKIVHPVLHRYLALHPDLKDDDFLFRSSRSGKPLTSIIVGRMIRQWCKAVGIPGHFGSHTLRKTWGYVARKENNIPWDLISHRLNHSNLQVTKVYLGISDDEVLELLQIAV